MRIHSLVQPSGKWNLVLRSTEADVPEFHRVACFAVIDNPNGEREGEPNHIVVPLVSDPLTESARLCSPGDFGDRVLGIDGPLVEDHSGWEEMAKENADAEREADAKKEDVTIATKLLNPENPRSGINPKQLRMLDEMVDIEGGVVFAPANDAKGQEAHANLTALASYGLVTPHQMSRREPARWLVTPLGAEVIKQHRARK